MNKIFITAEDMENTGQPPEMAGAVAGQRVAFIFLRGGILVRNFVNQEMLRLLRNSGHLFVIFSPDPDHPYLKRHFSAPCFVLAKMETATASQALWATRWRSFLVQVRRFTYGNTRFAENGCRRSLITALEREQMASSSFVGRLFYRSILWVAAAASRWRPIRRLLARIENVTVPFSAHEDFYQRYEPDMAVVTSLGFDVDTPVMREAHKHGARTTVLIKNWDVPTTRGIGGVMPDNVLVWNDEMHDEVVRYHDVPARCIGISGVSQWDHYFRSDAPVCDRDSFLRRYGLRPDRRTIYFAMTTPSHYKYNVTLARMLLEAMRDGRLAGETQLLVRLHPAYVLIGGMLSDEIRDELKALEREFGGCLAFSLPTSEEYSGFVIPGDGDDTDLKEILTHSDAMVTIYSTQILEGMIFDLPIINAGMFAFRDTGLPIATYEAWDHIRQVLDRDAVAYCYTMDEVVTAINDALSDPARGAAARRRITGQLFPESLRGRGGEESGRQLLALMETGRPAS